MLKSEQMQREVLNKVPSYYLDNKRRLLWCERCETTKGPMVHLNVKVKQQNTISQEIKRLGLVERTRTTIDSTIEWLCGQCFTNEFPQINHGSLKNFKDVEEEK